MIEPIELKFKADKDNKSAFEPYYAVNVSETVIDLAVF